LELLRLLDGEISRLGTLENLIHVTSGAPVQVVSVHAVAHKPPGFHKSCLIVYPWEPALYREDCNLSSLRKEDGARQHQDRINAFLACGAKCNLDVVGSSYFQVLNLYTERICGDVDLP